MLPECTVYAGPDKTGAAVRAVREQSPDVVLVDDGFQHLKLIRDIDIVVLDFDHPFGTGGVLPSGTLREFPNALRYADYYWVSRVEPGRSGEWMTRALSLFNWRAPIVTSRVMPGRLELMGGGSVDPAGLKVLAFCGIGSPEGFRRTLGLAGCEVLDMVRFPDHYEYRPEELAMLEERRRILKADFLVTTQKDSVKLGRTGREMNIGWLVVGLDVQGEHARLLDDIQALIRKRREAPR
jgi:tetraacyldisaccharide 4'-kinase